MKQQDKTPIIKTFLSYISFSLLFFLFAAVAGIAAFILQPNLNGIGIILIGLICGIPSSLLLFIRFRKNENNRKFKIFLVPSLIFPSLILLLLGWTAVQQRPENIFRVFIADPIPDGVSNIQAQDISAGFDQEIVAVFNATPEAIDQIIAINNLELDNDPYNFDRNDIPFEHFSNINENQNWVFYSKYDRENINWWLLWVNTDRTQAFFRFVDG